MDANALSCNVRPRRVALHFKYQLQHFLRRQCLRVLLSPQQQLLLLLLRLSTLVGLLMKPPGLHDFGTVYRCGSLKRIQSIGTKAMCT